MEPPADPELRRFVVELEFVQCLANFGYLHFLAQRRYLADESFVAYLRYLRYWESPPCVHALARAARAARALSPSRSTPRARERACVPDACAHAGRALAFHSTRSRLPARAATPSS